MNLIYRCMLLVLLGKAALLAGGAPIWGEPASGIRLGIKTGEIGGTAFVKLAFQNLAEAEQALIVGGESGVGSSYNVEFLATRSDGPSCKIIDTSVSAVAGMVVPIVFRLKPDEVREIKIAMKSLVCMGRDTNVPARVLLQQRYSIRASFTATAKGNEWGQLPRGWTGTVQSGPLAGK